MKKEINFESRGLTLSAAVITPETLKDKNPAVLFIHGLTGHKESCDQYANSLARLGFISFIFDMRGHGKSPGRVENFTLRNFLEDCECAYDVLASMENVDKENIHFVATSMGSCLAALLSSKRKAKTLVMRAPADYPDNVFDKPTLEHGGENPVTKAWRHSVRGFDGSFALTSLHSFEGLVFFIESENDNLVPHTTVQNYMNALKDKDKIKYILIKNAPHSIKEGPFRDEVERILVGWFKRIV